MSRHSPYDIELSGDERRKPDRSRTPLYVTVLRRDAGRAGAPGAQGLRNDQIAAQLDMPRQIVSKRRKRFHEQRLAGLAGLPRGGRPPGLPPRSGDRDQGAGL